MNKLGVVFFAVSNTTNPQTVSQQSPILSYLSPISDMVMAIASVANLLLIWYFFRQERSYRKQEKKDSIKLNWFRNIILEKNLKLIEEYFDKDLEIIDNCKAISVISGISKNEYDRLFKNQIGHYTDKKIILSQSFADLLSVIDESMGQAVDDLLEQFQDEFIDYLANLSVLNPTFTYSQCKSLIYNQKKKLLSYLYCYESKNCSL